MVRINPTEEPAMEEPATEESKYRPIDEVEQQITDVVRSLQTDRLISITVGTGTEGGFTVQLQQKALESTSEWFTKVLKHDTFIEGKAGKINFPEDDCEAWEVLVYWIMKHEFPLTAYTTPPPYLLATKCWALGDKYDIKAFQDEAMKALIHYTESDDPITEETPEDLAEILAACPAGSKLARLITEQLAHEFTNYEGRSAWESLSALPIGDLWKDLSRAQMEMAKEGQWYFLSRLGVDGKKEPGKAYWTEYMVGPPGHI